MDILSHGLWGGIAFGRRNKKKFWLSFLFGILPDLLSFGPFFVLIFLSLRPWPKFRIEEPPNVPDQIPSFVYQIYSITHSLIIFAAIFLLLYFIFKRPVFEFLAWGFHILLDIFTHSYAFFPTPFLWPFSDFQINGYPWASLEIFIPNILTLLVLYLWFFVLKKHKFKNKS